MDYLIIDNTHYGAVDVLLGLRKESGVWVIDHIPDFGQLSELRRAIKIAEYHWDDPANVVTIIEENTKLWFKFEHDVIYITRTDPGGTCTEIPMESAPAIHAHDHDHEHKAEFFDEGRRELERRTRTEMGELEGKRKR